MRASILPILFFATVGACLGPEKSAEKSAEEGAADVVESPVGQADPVVDDAELKARRAHQRALTRAQFETPTHGATGHAAGGCPLCADPMKGKVPDDALIVGPATVWN